jgi:PAS domain S-box-containing protein
MLLPLELNETILSALGIFSTLAAALLVIPRVREIVIGPIKGWWRRRRQRHDMLGEVLQLLAPNGGKSIADAVQRLEDGQRAVTAQLAVLMADTRRQNELLFAGFDLQEQPLMYADEDGDCVFANRSFCDITGIRAEDAHGSGWSRALHGGDRVTVVEEIRAAAEEQRAYSMVCRLVHQGTGATTQVRATGRPIRDRSGQVSGHLRIFSLTARDVP